MFIQVLLTRMSASTFFIVRSNVEEKQSNWIEKWSIIESYVKKVPRRSILDFIRNPFVLTIERQINRRNRMKRISARLSNNNSVDFSNDEKQELCESIQVRLKLIVEINAAHEWSNPRRSIEIAQDQSKRNSLMLICFAAIDAETEDADEA